jgi:hypothetical protein
MIRRTVRSVAAHWNGRRNKRQAALSGFLDFMSTKNSGQIRAQGVLHNVC